jgi:hypothetical protein
MDRELICSMYGLARRTGDCRDGCRYDCRDKACLVSTSIRSHRYGFDAKPWERGSSSCRFQFRTRRCLRGLMDEWTDERIGSTTGFVILWIGVLGFIIRKRNPYIRTDERITNPYIPTFGLQIRMDERTNGRKTGTRLSVLL